MARRARGPAPWARPARWVSLGLAAAMLAACTPAPSSSSQEPSPRAEAGPTSSPSSTSPGVVPNPEAESDAPQGQAGATITIDSSTGEVVSDGDAPVDGESGGVLGRGADAPGSLQKAHGLSWANGTAVNVSAISIPQARHATGSSAPTVTLNGSTLPNPLADPQEITNLQGGSESFMPFQATADRIFGVLQYALEVSEDDTGTSVYRLGYVDRSGWHAGPRMQTPLDYGAPPSALVNGRLYWLENADSENGGMYFNWSIKSWAPGEKKAKTHLSDKSKGVPADFAAGSFTLGSPMIMAVTPTAVYVAGASNGLFESSLNAADALLLLRMELGGQKKVTVIKRASNPIAVPAGLVYTSAAAEPVNMDSLYGPPPGAVKMLAPDGTESTLLRINLKEAQIGLTEDTSFESETTTDDEQPLSPLPSTTPLTVLDASGEALLIRQRGQLLRLNLRDHSATRVIPAERYIVNSSGSALLCAGRAYFLSSASSGSAGLTLFSLGSDGRLQWVSDSANTLSLACNGSTLMSGGLSGSDSGEVSPLNNLRIRALPRA